MSKTDGTGNGGGVAIEEIAAGEDGRAARTGDRVAVHYVARIAGGREFDSSLAPGRHPFEFTLGAGEVVRGWDEGIPGMTTGGRRRLTITPEYGYGSRWMGSVPPNSTLVFEIELVKILSEG